MRELAEFQLMKQEAEKRAEQKAEKKFKIKLEKERKQDIKNFIKYFSKSNMETYLIINQLVEIYNLTKEDAEEYLTMYNKGEL